MPTRHTKRKLIEIPAMPPDPSPRLPVVAFLLSWAGVDCTVAARGNDEQSDEWHGLFVLGCCAFGWKNAYASGEIAVGLSFGRP